MFYEDDFKEYNLNDYFIYLQKAFTILKEDIKNKQFINNYRNVTILVIFATITKSNSLKNKSKIQILYLMPL